MIWRAVYVYFFGPNNLTSAQGRPILEASRLYTVIHHSPWDCPGPGIGPFAETSTSQHKTHETDIHAPGGIQTRNPSKR
jgi:hypothetical protein